MTASSVNANRAKRIEHAGLLTFATDGPGAKRLPGDRRLEGRSILANEVDRRSGLYLAEGQFETGYGRSDFSGK
jgi:hypothetical protein